MIRHSLFFSPYLKKKDDMFCSNSLSTYEQHLVYRATSALVSLTVYLDNLHKYQGLKREKNEINMNLYYSYFSSVCVKLWCFTNLAHKKWYVPAWQFGVESTQKSENLSQCPRFSQEHFMRCKSLIGKHTVYICCVHEGPIQRKNCNQARVCFRLLSYYKKKYCGMCPFFAEFTNVIAIKMIWVLQNTLNHHRKHLKT